MVGVPNFHRGVILRDKFSNLKKKPIRQTNYNEASLCSADQFVKIKIHGVVLDHIGARFFHVRISRENSLKIFFSKTIWTEQIIACVEASSKIRIQQTLIKTTV